MSYQRNKQTEHRQDEFTNRPTQDQTRQFEIVMPLLQSMLAEVKELAKKKQDAPVNQIKVRMVNRLLEDVRKVLDQEPEMAYLDILDEESLPEYSDSVVVLSQYLTAMERFEERHWDLSGWKTDK
jgi:hypothetical protein